MQQAEKQRPVDSSAARLEPTFNQFFGATSPAGNRLSWLLRIAVVASLALAVRILYLIVREYPSYWPPDFDSAFLTGREPHFHGAYASAFYTHILVGPIVIVVAIILVVTGGRPSGRSAHRRLGRSQALLVVILLTPSGLVMAPYAFSGRIAAMGFITLSAFSASSAIAAFYFARKRNWPAHRRWAIRCFVLLCSPLLLRLVGGGLMMLDLESTSSYQLNAWLSWLVPLSVTELYLRQTTHQSH